MASQKCVVIIIILLLLFQTLMTYLTLPACLRSAPDLLLPFSCPRHPMSLLCMPVLTPYSYHASVTLLGK